MSLVGLVEPFLSDIKGIGIHHDELTTAQDAGTRTSLVAILVLNLIEAQWQVLVRGVQVLDHEGEHLLMGRSQQHVHPLTVFETEEVIAVLDPASGLLVRVRSE